MSRRKGPTMRRPTPRTLDGVPGTVEHGFREREIVEVPIRHDAITQAMEVFAPGITETLRQYTMGPCNILVGHEPVGRNGTRLWHLSISTPSRHPSYDEIKVARYRLLPSELTFGILLPPPEDYVNVPEQDHTFHCWQVEDPRAHPEFWTE